MDSLPSEILNKIIGQLPINEISKCRCVCIKWKWCIDTNLRLNDLVISDQVLTNQQWYFQADQMVDYFNWIKQLKVFEKFNQPTLKNLKQLYIYSYSQVNSLGPFLSNLKQLQQLEINNLAINEPLTTLSLPNLTHLSLNAIKFNAITFDTSSLTHLKINCTSKKMKIQFTNPTTIRYLEILNYQPIIASMTNLEQLFCKEFDFPVDVQWLKGLPKLNEIHFNHSHRQRNDVFVQLKQHNQQLKLNLQIYNFGLNLNTLPSIKLDDGSIYVSSETTQFICDHYNRLAKHVPFISGIDYTVIAKHFVELPACFTSRFSNINTIRVNGKANAKQLIKFLKNYRNLKSLHLSFTSLKQKFYNLIPYICPNLVDLNVNENHDVNFYFAMKFKKLFSIDTNQQLSSDLIYHLLKSTDLKQLFFCYENEYLALSNDSGIYRFGPASEEPDEFTSLDEMFNRFKELIYHDSYQHYLRNEFEQEEDTMDLDQMDEIDKSICSQMNDTIDYEDELTLSQISNELSDELDEDYDFSDMDSELNEDNESTDELIVESDNEEKLDDLNEDLDNISVIFDDSDNESTLELNIDDVEVTFSEDEDDL